LLDYAFRYKGDCVVMGGGKSLDYYPDNFFRGRFVIGVNQSYRKHTPDILVRKERVEPMDFPVYASLHAMGDYGHPQNQQGPGITLFNHNCNAGPQKIDVTGLHPAGDKIMVAGSTIVSAIHLAAVMGFTGIFLAGHDLCSVDGDNNFTGYYDDVIAMIDEGGYRRWLDRVAWQTRFVANYIGDLYGANVVSLSPFFGLNTQEAELD